MMRYWALDLIRCLGCKHYPLEMIIFEKEYQEDIDVSNLEKPLCKNYCAYKRQPVKTGVEYPCEECLRTGPAYYIVPNALDGTLYVTVY